MPMQTTFLAIVTLAALICPNPARAGARSGGSIVGNTASLFGTAALDVLKMSPEVKARVDRMWRSLGIG